MNSLHYKHLKPVFPRWMHPIIAIFMPLAWLTHKVATDPRWQFTLNAFFTVFWLIAMILIPHFRALYGNTAGLIIEEISLWANMFTHFGALGSNLAAMMVQSNNRILQSNADAALPQLPIANIFEAEA